MKTYPACKVLRDSYEQGLPYTVLSCSTHLGWCCSLIAVKKLINFKILLFFSVTVKLDTVGSCCTLIAEELLDDQEFELDNQVAELLYGSSVFKILDTVH